MLAADIVDIGRLLNDGISKLRNDKGNLKKEKFK